MEERGEGEGSSGKCSMCGAFLYTKWGVIKIYRPVLVSGGVERPQVHGPSSAQLSCARDAANKTFACTHWRKLP